MDPDEAPPPYAPVDPLLSANANSNAISPINSQQPSMQLRGGEAPIPYAYSDVSSTFSAGHSSLSSVSPVNYLSAVGAVEERPPPAFQERDVLQHHLTIYPKTQAKDFPRRPRCWNAVADEISQQDWDTFLNFLFPPHLAPAATSDLLSPRLRAEIQRDRKDRPQETDDERKLRIAAVISEWNQRFFLPRGTQISWIYVADLESAPSSPLCPRCYPAATSASQNRRTARSRSVETLVPPSQIEGPSQLDPSQTPMEASDIATNNRVEFQTPPCISSAIKSLAPWGLFPGASASGWSRATPADQYRWPSPAWPVGPQTGPSQHRGVAGPLGWIADISMNATRFAEHVSIQAEECGRRIEEQAMAHGRWLEEQARSRGRQIEEMGQSFAGIGSRASAPCEWGHGPCSLSWGQRGQWGEDRGRGRRNRRRGRSSSTDSSSSASSFSSIDTISTTSDLEVTDLSSVRAQLSSLNGHHHRDSYAAALRLRHHLQALQQLRRHARFNGSRGGGFGMNACWGGHWGNSRGFRGRGRPFGTQHHGLRRAPWEAPIELQDSPAQRRALKEEKKAVEKAFRDIVRRARDEARETRRNRRSGGRRERRRGHRQQPTVQPYPASNATNITSPDSSISFATRALSSLTLSDAESRSRT